MKRTILLFTLVIFAFGLNMRSIAAGTPDEQSGCTVVEQALDSVSKLKPGMLRADVERDFQPDGGISVRDRATYTYRRCHYIKINVAFSTLGNDPSAERSSPEDQISKVSAPFLAYPVSD
jgi:hypothetical protein